jgi:DNA modification methylase
VIICGDSLDVLKTLDADSVDAVVTSPPYDNMRGYEPLPHGKFQAIAKELFRVIKNGCAMVWIVGDATIDGSETGTSFKQCLSFMDIGFKLHDTMVWEKGTSAFQHRVRYISCFEFMFVLAKGSLANVHLIKDRANKWAGTQIHGTERQPDNSTKKLSTIHVSKKVKDFGARTNIWSISPEKNSRAIGHPAVFPVKLVEDHLRSWVRPGGVVLDPFTGSGTTGVACKNLGFNFIGIEMNEEYVEIARKRVGE